MSKDEIVLVGEKQVVILKLKQQIGINANEDKEKLKYLTWPRFQDQLIKKQQNARLKKFKLTSQIN